jgi:hypothetical protein
MRPVAECFDVLAGGRADADGDQGLYVAPERGKVGLSVVAAIVGAALVETPS